MPWYLVTLEGSAVPRLSLIGEQVAVDRLDFVTTRKVRSQDETVAVAAAIDEAAAELHQQLQQPSPDGTVPQIALQFRLLEVRRARWRDRARRDFRGFTFYPGAAES
jgi:hypothetical protein